MTVIWGSQMVEKLMHALLHLNVLIIYTIFSIMDIANVKAGIDNSRLRIQNGS